MESDSTLSSTEPQPKQSKLTLTIPLYKFQECYILKQNPTKQYIHKFIHEIMASFKNQIKTEYYPYWVYKNDKQECFQKIKQSQCLNENINIKVYFKNQYSLLKQKLNKIERGLNQCRKHWDDKETQSITVLQNRNKLLEAAIVVSYIFCDPLVKIINDQPMSTMFQQLNIQADINRIKKELERTKRFLYNLEIHAQPGNIENIQKSLQNGNRILHLICNVQKVQQEVFLLLEDNDGIGKESRITIKDMFLMNNKQILYEFLPKIIIMIGHKVSIAAKEMHKFLSDQTTQDSTSLSMSIVYIQTCSFNKDTFAQNLVRKLYYYLCENHTIENSVEKALKYARQSPSSKQKGEICCCLHEHYEDCKYMIQVKKYGTETCHNRYHNTFMFCKCMSFPNYKKIQNECPFGTKLKEIFNQNFKYPNQKTFCQHFCCCRDFSNEQSIDLHKNTTKIRHYKVEVNHKNKADVSVDNQNNQIFRKIDRVKISQFVITGNQYSNLVCDFDFRLNKHIYNVIVKIHKNKQINLFGSRKGKYTTIRQAMGYMLKRKYSEYTLQSHNLKGSMKIWELKNNLQKFLNSQENKERDSGLALIIRDSYSYSTFLQDKQFEQIRNKLRKDYPKLLLAIISQQEPLSNTSKNSILNIHSLDLDSIQIVIWHDDNKTLQKSFLLNLDDACVDPNHYLNTDDPQCIVISLRKDTSKYGSTFDKQQKSIIGKQKLFKNLIEEFLKKQNSFCNFEWIFKFLYQFQKGFLQFDLQLLKFLSDNYKLTQLFQKFLQLIRGLNSLQNRQVSIQLNKYLDISYNQKLQQKHIKLNKSTKDYFKNEFKQSRTKITQFESLFMKYMCYYIKILIKTLPKMYMYHEDVYEFSDISQTGFMQLNIHEMHTQVQGQKSYEFGTVEMINGINHTKNKSISFFHQSFNIHMKNIDQLNTILNKVDFIKYNKQQDQEYLELDKCRYYKKNLVIDIVTIAIAMKKYGMAINLLQKSFKLIQNQQHFPNLYLVYYMKLSIIKLGFQLKNQPSNDQYQTFLQNIQNQRIKNQKLVKQSKQNNRYKEKTYEKIQKRLSIANYLVELEVNFIQAYFILWIKEKPTIEQLDFTYQKINKYWNDAKSYSKSISTDAFAKINRQRLKKRLSNYKLKYLHCLYQQLHKCKQQGSNEQLVSRIIKIEQNQKIKPQFIDQILKYQNEGYKKLEQKEKSYKNLYLLVKMNLYYLEILIHKKRESKLFNDSQINLQELTNFYKNIQEVINNQHYNLYDTLIMNHFERLAAIFKQEVKKQTENCMIMLISNPYSQQNSKKLKTITRNYQYKYKLSEDMKLKKKEVLFIQKVLTSTSLKQILKLGCRVLTLVVDCLLDKNDSSVMVILEDQNAPIEDIKTLVLFKKQFQQSNIGILVLCGSNSIKLGKEIKSYSFKNKPAIIIIDTFKSQQIPFQSKQTRHNSEQESSVMTNNLLKAFVRNKFIQHLNTSFYENLLAFKQISSANFNQKVKSIAQKSFHRTLRYIMKQYDSMHNYEYLITTMSPKMYEGKPRDIIFKEGQFRDISYVPQPHTNIKLNKELIGRYQTVAKICSLILQSKNARSNLCLNIYGKQGMGKLQMCQEVCQVFISRNKFKKGIFIIDCKNIVKGQSCQGNILEDIWQSQKQQFSILKKFFDRKQTEEADQKEKGLKQQQFFGFLLILNNFEQFQVTKNNDFFLKLFQANIQLITITSQKYVYDLHNVKFPYKNLQNIQIEELTFEQMCFLVYSNTDFKINTFYKHGKGKLTYVENQIRQFQQNEFLPNKINQLITQLNVSIIKQDYNRSQLYQNTQEFSKNLSKSFINGHDSNTMISMLSSNATPQTDTRIRKIKLVGRKKE